MKTNILVVFWSHAKEEIIGTRLHLYVHRATNLFQMWFFLSLCWIPTDGKAAGKDGKDDEPQEEHHHEPSK